MADSVAVRSTDDVARARAAHSEIVRGRNVIRQAWVWLAGRLYEFHRAELWAPLSYGSFKEWTESPDVDISQSYALHLIQLHRELVLERGVDPARLARVGMQKVQAALPAILDGSPVHDVVADCERLTRAELKRLYGGRLERHPDEGVIPCPTCGRYYRPTGGA